MFISASLSYCLAVRPSVCWSARTTGNVNVFSNILTKLHSKNMLFFYIIIIEGVSFLFLSK